MLQNGFKRAPTIVCCIHFSQFVVEGWFTFLMINGDQDAQMFSGNPELYLRLDTHNIYRLWVEGIAKGEHHLQPKNYNTC